MCASRRRAHSGCPPQSSLLLGSAGCLRAITHPWARFRGSTYREHAWQVSQISLTARMLLMSTMSAPPEQILNCLFLFLAIYAREASMPVSLLQQCHMNHMHSCGASKIAFPSSVTAGMVSPVFLDFAKHACMLLTPCTSPSLKVASASTCLNRCTTHQSARWLQASARESASCSQCRWRAPAPAPAQCPRASPAAHCRHTPACRGAGAGVRPSWVSNW